MKTSEDSKKSYRVERIVKKNTQLVLIYFSLYSILLLFIIGYKEQPLLIFISIFLNVLFAFISFKYFHTNKYKILNYYPYWFYISTVTFVGLLVTDVGLYKLVDYKLIVSIGIILHAILWIYALGIAENIYDDKEYKKELK